MLLDTQPRIYINGSGSLKSIQSTLGYLLIQRDALEELVTPDITSYHPTTD